MLATVPNIPIVVDFKEPYFVMAPLAEDFSSGPHLFGCRYACQLLDTLQAAHQAGYIHRDVRPANILRHGGNVLLVDWAFAVKVEKSEVPRPAVTFEGTVSCASDAQLDQLAALHTALVPREADDLCALVRSVMLLYISGLPAALPPDENGMARAVALKEWWQKRQIGIWHELNKAAEACEYAAMRDLFERVLLP